MYISEMPFFLTWDKEGSKIMEAVQNSYRDFIYTRIGEFLAKISNKFELENIQKDLFALPTEAFYRIIEAPEVTYRLIWPERNDFHESLFFIKRALEAERARLGQPVTVDLPIWTALGDMVLEPDARAMYAPFETSGTMPVDYSSPYASLISLEEQHIPNVVARENLTSQELAIVHQRFAKAMKGIASTSSLIFGFSNRFNKVVIFQRDPDLPTEFTSGSSAQFIGRSILANPHLESVDEVYIAEGIVHEGIHSILYMQEIQQPWVNVREYYSTPKLFISPWTGNKLPLRPFLQACFVWYGLLHFWCLAFEERAFDLEKTQSRIQQAARGFLVRDLSYQLEPYKHGIHTDILDAVLKMEKNVKQAFQDAVAL